MTSKTLQALVAATLFVAAPMLVPTSSRADEEVVSGSWKMTLPRGLQKDAAYVPEKNPVTDADVKAEYDKFVAANSGKEYRARHILVEKEEEAKAIIASLKGGAKFEDIAKKQSKDPGSGANGGDLDWAPAASYVPEFSEAMVKLEKGKVSEAPVKTQFGWHVIRVDDIRQAELPKLEEVKPQIVQQLQGMKLNQFQQDLRSKAKIQ